MRKRKRTGYTSSFIGSTNERALKRKTDTARARGRMQPTIPTISPTKRAEGEETFQIKSSKKLHEKKDLVAKATIVEKRCRRSPFHEGARTKARRNTYTENKPMVDWGTRRARGAVLHEQIPHYSTGPTRKAPSLRKNNIKNSERKHKSRNSGRRRNNSPIHEGP